MEDSPCHLDVPSESQERLEPLSFLGIFLLFLALGRISPISPLTSQWLWKRGSIYLQLEEVSDPSVDQQLSTLGSPLCSRL